MSDEHNKTNLSDIEKMLDYKYGLQKPIEFDFFSEITEKELKDIGEMYQIENLSPGEFPSPAFPVKGYIRPITTRLMVPLVCQWYGRPNKPMTNVWFLVHTGAPITFLTALTIEKLVDDTKIHTPPGINISIQDKKNVFPCGVSKGNFKETNILGMDVMRELKLQLHVDWEQNMFQLINKAAGRLIRRI